MIAIVGLTLFTVIIGIQVGTPDGSGLAQPTDQRIANWVASHRFVGLVSVAELANTLGSTGPMVVLTLGLGVWLFRCSTRKLTLIAPLASIAGTQVVVQLSKVLVARPRPDATYSSISQAGFAWPSGHAATATALAVSVSLIVGSVLVARTTVKRIRWLLADAAFVIALSRIALGVHWASDVVMGVVVGSSVAWTVTRSFISSTPSSSPKWHVSKRSWIITGGISLAILIPTGTSYRAALNAPGAATLDVRSVEWLRDHGLNGPVDRAESWWLWRNAPSTTARLTSLPSAPLALASPVHVAPVVAEKRLLTPIPPVAIVPAPAVTPASQWTSELPRRVLPQLKPELPGEGVWTVAQASTGGELSIATTSLRPDVRHPGVVATLAWMNAKTTQFALIRGTRQPGGGAGPAHAAVPIAERPRLLAAFNSGYKLEDTPGGANEEGVLIRPLQPGIATFGIRTDGSAAVIEWGRDPVIDASMISARQNLHLIVDHEQLVEGLRLNVGGRWGAVKHALPTWRSGVGIDATGNAIYASGDGLTLDTLAESLRQAGAVSAMELDIHKKMVIFNLFTHAMPGGAPLGRKLSPAMRGSTNRYLVADQRDFIMVTQR